MKRLVGEKPNCKECRVELYPSNNIIDYIVKTYGNILMQSTGEAINISPEGIRLVMDIENIDDKVTITQKLLVYLQEVINIQHRSLDE